MFSAGTIQTRNPADAGLLGQVDVKCPSLKDGHLARPSHVLRQVHLWDKYEKQPVSARTYWDKYEKQPVSARTYWDKYEKQPVSARTYWDKYEKQPKAITKHCVV